MTLFQLTRLPPNVAGRQRVVDSDICWIFGIFLSYDKQNQHVNDVNDVNTSNQQFNLFCKTYPIAQKNAKNPTDVAVNNALSARNIWG